MCRGVASDTFLDACSAAPSLPDMCDPFREPVSLSAVDPEWSRQYAEQAARIADVLGALAPTIEHIGSTSVPLRGKPIIDIQVAVEEASLARAIVALEELGYRHHGQGAVPGREYLTSRPVQGPSVNVHVFAGHSSLLRDNRIIRDYLRAHPDAAREYVSSKEKALEEGHTDLRAYSHAKAQRVAAIREAAYRWARAAED
jgi:GrpB-like predicted nucleotidyltransferase (UPF0157 family)